MSWRNIGFIAKPVYRGFLLSAIERLVLLRPRNRSNPGEKFERLIDARLVALHFCSQDGAGGERGPAGGHPDGQQVLVRCLPDVPGDGGPASFDAGEAGRSHGPPLHQAARNGRDIAPRQ